MKFSNISKHSLRASLLPVAVVAAVALASNVTLPNTFSSGSPARAAEVNANFTAVKMAVDDNHARIQALEATRTYTPVTFSAGWGNVGTNWQTVEYTKDALGFVHLRGLTRRTNPTAGPTIFVLPAQFRPSATLQYPARCGDHALCYILVNANGNVDFGGPAMSDPGTSVTVDGIIFDPN
ncbi:MAG: hypothetical protein AB1938_04705 [Myxococcota bacterium]